MPNLPNSIRGIGSVATGIRRSWTMVLIRAQATKAALSLTRTLARDKLLLTLLLALAALAVITPDAIRQVPSLVDWPTIAGLTGLLALTRGVELSGHLHQLGERLITSMHTERTLALCLVIASALLAMLLTNDVALFIVVPLTITLHGVAALPITRLIVFEALAVNAGSTLTPIGNPQNLFLWQFSQSSFPQFVDAMLPLTLLLMLPLLALTAAAFAAKPVKLHEEMQPPPRQTSLLVLCLVLYPPFLILADLNHAVGALCMLLLVFAWRHRAVLVRIDWSLIAIFILMFVDLRLFAHLRPVVSLVHEFGLDNPMPLYLVGVSTSQIISNVPAAILLEEYSKDWQTIAYAVNTGGFGLALGSLANLIALRMSRDRRAWLLFHAYSVPFLIVAAGLVYLWLFVR